MASVLEALLILVGHPGGLALVQQQVTNQLASLAVFDVNAPAVAVAYAARYNPGVVLCCRVPADERLNPTVNVTAAQQALLGPPLAQAFANLAARGGVWAVKANGCICAAGANANPFKPPCKGAPGVARAVVNGMQV
jgi:hypothetical protein